MIIVLKPNAPPAVADQILERIAALGLKPLHMPGTERVVLGVNPALGRPEHHEFRWVDLAEAYALAAPRLQAVISWAASKLLLAAQLAR